MKIINTQTHGYLDYSFAFLLILSPWIFDFYNRGIESWIPIVLGVSTIIYSLITNYELGVVKVLNIQSHLVIDFFAGVFLAASPWIFGFEDVVYLPHLVLGLTEVLISVMTDGKKSTLNHQNRPKVVSAAR